MSDRQNLAEHGTALCVAGLAMAGLTAAPALASLTPLAVLVAWGIDRFKRCKTRQTQQAVTAVIKCLENTNASDRGVRAALQLLRENQTKVRITAQNLADKEVRNAFPDALYDIVFKDVTVPADDGVETILRNCLRSAYETLRLDEDFDKVFVQEGVVEISKAIDTGFADITRQLDRVEDKLADIQQTLSNLQSATRDQLEALANRFGIEAVYDRTDEDLRQLLTKKAEEYRALKAEVDAIPESMKRLANLKAAAQGAIDRVDLDEVETLMSMVQEAELDEAAKSAEIRANNALLRGKVDQAANLLCAAADSFSAIDPLEPTRRKVRRYFAILYNHGLRYGGRGLPAAVALLRPTLSNNLKQQDDELWAASQNNLAIALRNQGTRTEGPKGAELLAEAVTAYRDALQVYTRKDHPVDWAMTQNNLAIALSDQGTRTEGPKGAELLAEAVTAYSDALQVRTRKEHPVQWAMTQENTAIAQLEIAKHATCPDPDAALSLALAAVDAALTVYDPDHMSYDHGTATALRTKILAARDALS